MQREKDQNCVIAFIIVKVTVFTYDSKNMHMRLIGHFPLIRVCDLCILHLVQQLQG